jgi:hypothetical protein
MWAMMTWQWKIFQFLRNLLNFFPFFLFQQNKIVFFLFYAQMEISLSTNPCLTDCYLVDTVMTLPWLHVIWSKNTWPTVIWSTQLWPCYCSMSFGRIFDRQKFVRHPLHLKRLVDQSTVDQILRHRNNASARWASAMAFDRQTFGQRNTWSTTFWSTAFGSTTFCTQLLGQKLLVKNFLVDNFS